MKRLVLVLFVLVLAMLACGESRSSISPSSELAPAKAACETVRYEIKNTAGSVEAVSVTLSNATGDTEQGDYKVPFRKTFEMCDTRNFKYISAQIISPTTGAGSIECKITVDTVVVSTAKAVGFPNIAGCSD